MKKLSKQYGFSLIEVLVAFSIFAVSLGLILQIYSKGATSARLTEEYTNAVIIAQSKLASVSTLGTEIDFLDEEVIDIYTVNTELSEVELESNTLTNKFNSSMVRTWNEVNVRWESLQQSRSITLKTLRLFPAS